VTVITGEPYESEGRVYVSDGASIWAGSDSLTVDLEGPRIDELRTLLSRGLNTWERAPEWLLKLAEIVDR
jgi:hypothetical protein